MAHAVEFFAGFVVGSFGGKGGSVEEVVLSLDDPTGRRGVLVSF